jgi:hypothetical protein
MSLSASEIRPDLLSLDIPREDAEQQIHLVFQVLKEPELDVGVVAGQHAGRVVVEEELPAELEVEAIVGLPDPLQDLRRLLLDVLFVVKPHLSRHRSPLAGVNIKENCHTRDNGYPGKSGLDSRIRGSDRNTCPLFHFIHNSSY